jgi:hypothetical protein
MSIKSAKKARLEAERKRRCLRMILPKVMVCIQLEVGDEALRKWIHGTETFPELLRLIANEVLGDAEDVDNAWIKGLCWMFTDVAEAEKTPEQIDTPKEIFLWFARYVESMLSKPDLNWETSKCFTEASLNAACDFLEQCKILHAVREMKEEDSEELLQ